jgi:hypothetical protein
MISELTKPLHSLNWDDTPAVDAATSKVLAALADDRDLLQRLAHQVPQDDHLSGLSEHYDILDKLVLHDDPTGWRIRLHVFLPGYYDRPHNHRWTYSSRILRGSYHHTLYGLDDILDEAMDVSALQPYMVRTETAADSYTLHHRMIHAAVAEPHTVTLIVRGPRAQGPVPGQRPRNGPGLVAVRRRERIAGGGEEEADESDPDQPGPQ